MSLSKGVSYSNRPKTSEVFYYTVKEKLRYHAENTPSKVACIVYDTYNLEKRSSITCSELYMQACCFARGLRKLGLRHGDIVGVSLPNGPTAMICIYGTQLAGCIPLLFMFNRKDGGDIMDVFRKCETCTAIICDPGRDEINWMISRNIIEEILPDGSAKSKQIQTLRYFVSTRVPGDKEGVCTIQTILKMGQNEDEVVLPDLDPDNIATIIMTSGSTGTPKLVQLTYINLFDFASNAVESGEMNENDIFFNGNSFNWIGGFPHIYLYKGITRVTCTNILGFTSRSDMNKCIMKAVQSEKCTAAFISVPSILELSKRSKEESIWAKSLKILLTGAIPVPSSCANILHIIGEKLVIFYGMTEIGIVTRLIKEKGQMHENYTAGTPLPGFEIKIVDDSGAILPVNQTGEVYVRHCSTHLLYLNDREKSDTVYLPSRWYRTNDMGYMNGNGEFIIHGRKSEIIKIGEDFMLLSYPESIIQKHPDVQEVVVTVIPDDLLFQQLCACIVPRPGHNLSEEAIDELFQKELVLSTVYRGTAPKYYLFFDCLPKTVLGKTSRPKTKELALERLHLSQR